MTSALPTDATRFDSVVAGQRVRWYPTKGQRDLAHRCFGQARMVYNQALHQSEAAYRGGQKLSISHISQLWTQFKAAHPEHADIPSSVAVQALRHLDSAFQYFFRRVKLGQKPGYPTPKDARSPDQCSLCIDPRQPAPPAQGSQTQPAAPVPLPARQPPASPAQAGFSSNAQARGKLTHDQA